VPVTVLERLKAWWEKPVTPDDEDPELDPTRRDEMIEWTAQQAKRFGIIAPAYIFAEASRPVMFVYSQFAHFFSPFADTLLGGNRAQEVGYLMQDPKNLDKFLERLEELGLQETDRERQEREARKAARRRSRAPQDPPSPS